MKSEEFYGAVDIHAHYYPETYLRLIASEGGEFGAHYREDPAGPVVDVGPLHAGPLDRKFIDLDMRLAEMDRQGVAVQALSLTQPMVYWAGDRLSRRLSAAYNDALILAHEAHPQRLFGLAMLPVQAPAEALGEIERIARGPGIRGVYMATVVGDRELSNESLFPIYERLAEYRLPVFLHPVEVIGMQDRLRQYFLSNLLGNPFDTAIAAAHLILGGVLDRFPELDVVLPHAGGALPFLVGRLQHGWSVRPECSHLDRGPQDYFKRFYYDTISHSHEALSYLIDMAGSDRVLLGSDFCFDMGYERPVEVVNSHKGLDEAARRAVLETNGRKLLRL